MTKSLKDPPKKKKAASAKWTRTTVLIRKDNLEKFKILAWWEKKTVKDLFDEMVENYLASKNYIDHLIEQRAKTDSSGCFGIPKTSKN